MGNVSLSEQVTDIKKLITELSESIKGMGSGTYKVTFTVTATLNQTIVGPFGSVSANFSFLVVDGVFNPASLQQTAGTLSLANADGYNRTTVVITVSNIQIVEM